MKTMVVLLLVLFMCAGCREEVATAGHVQTDSARNRESDVRNPATIRENDVRNPATIRESDERISAIEREMSNMPQKLSGTTWKTMFWGCDLIKSIMALDERDERTRLMNQYLDSVSKLAQSLHVQRDLPLAFWNYDELIGASTIFKAEPEMAERILGIMCDCVRLHRQEVEKWADAINNEPNHRKRVSMKNVHGCLNSYFMMLTNHVERTYFPRMKTHGIPPDRHETWRTRIDDAAGRQ